MFRYFVILVIILKVITAKNEVYKGYRVYNLYMTSQLQQDYLDKLKDDKIDYWQTPSYTNRFTGKAMVPPLLVHWFEDRLTDLGIDIDKPIDDVYKFLLVNDINMESRDAERNFNFEGFHRYDTILEHLYSLQNLATSNIEIINFGTTAENRPLVYARVSNNFNSTKPIVVIEGGINPREWITIPASISILNKITDETQYLDDFDWIIVPVVNPDGYEYTHTTDRLWTKSVSASSNLGLICPGVNINRNFDVDWLKSGSSSSPCSHNYAGTEAFSEPESQLIKHIIQENSDRIKLYVSIQNNGKFISYPWQYEKASSGLFRQHHFLAMNISTELEQGYNYGASWLMNDRVSGTSADYAQLNNVPYSLNINIAQDENNSVLIPAIDIAGKVDTVWKAVSAAVRSLR